MRQKSRRQSQAGRSSGAAMRLVWLTMKRNEPVSKIMSTGMITVHHGDPVSRVRELFQKHGIHHLPVVSGHKLLGIISFTDLMRVSFGDAFNADTRAVDATLDHTMTIEQLMKKEPRCIRRDATVRDAAEILVGGEFHSVPVVDTDGTTLVGMVTSTDLIRHLLDQY
jgi:CBS domain-containing protein